MASPKHQVIINGERLDADQLNFRPPPPTAEAIAETQQRLKESGEKQRRAAEGWPRTVEQAVAQLLKSLDEPSKQRLRAIERDQLIDLHFSWGMGIRNAFGLWGDNQELMRSCGREHPDDCSSVIMNAVWDALR